MKKSFPHTQYEVKTSGSSSLPFPGSAGVLNGDFVPAQYFIGIF
jgi:hypothetical protein